MPERTSSYRADDAYCERCDVLVGMDGVDRDDGGSLTVRVVEGLR